MFERTLVNVMQTTIECFLALGISLYLSTFESIEKRHVTILTCVGWAIYIIFAKGGVKWHLHH